MELSVFAPIVVVLSCANGDGTWAQCSAPEHDASIVTASGFVVCRLEAKVSRRDATAAFAASCSRGAHVEVRELSRDDGAGRDRRILAAVFY